MRLEGECEEEQEEMIGEDSVRDSGVDIIIEIEMMILSHNLIEEAKNEDSIEMIIDLKKEDTEMTIIDKNIDKIKDNHLVVVNIIETIEKIETIEIIIGIQEKEREKDLVEMRETMMKDQRVVSVVEVDSL